MKYIFTRQPDIVTAATDFVICMIAIIFIIGIIRACRLRNTVWVMCILIFTAVFVSGISGAMLHGLTAVEQSYQAERILRGVTASSLGAVAIPVVYLCTYCASSSNTVQKATITTVILWVITVIFTIISAVHGNKAFEAVYIYTAACIIFVLCECGYCIASGKASEMKHLIIGAAVAGTGIAMQNFIVKGRTLNLIFEFNNSGMAHLAVITALPFAYVWCIKIIAGDRD